MMAINMIMKDRLYECEVTITNLIDCDCLVILPVPFRLYTSTLSTVCTFRARYRSVMGYHGEKIVEIRVLRGLDFVARL